MLIVLLTMLKECTEISGHWKEIIEKESNRTWSKSDWVRRGINRIVVIQIDQNQLLNSKEDAELNKLFEYMSYVTITLHYHHDLYE